ncbi:MAG: acyl-CoA dehydrogenase family protein [Muribaculaceae bacterium]|jgi:acyl-coA dehydrogenase|uniref:acyl-CoA dehydrogenase family protein n=1 Tax=Candidatus Limisoma sp. TaxID=3076476 RepID=UPI000A629E22|nr:acyl-CoA dehydrogenase family protein [Muribaculaceae bacterium]MBS7150696.1 acyl-CoA dehydrogenase family protein [Prevotella sp.]MBS7208023.1 acyl-CoA dehydrogenase family protein [Prevotella sp.]MEE0624992.1 acyl-CoA dehydrogenase family protein [Muribaculaceae bacterium]UKI24937.1 MAG: acyl-CoA dehydrogenase family protein [Bacteroidales bacterium]
MSNFYNDNPDLKHHLSHPLMRKIVEMKERNFSDAEKFDYAPLDYEDAMDSYEKVLEIAGEISGEIVAQNAEDVDHEGPHVVDGHVVYAKGTQKNLDALVKAGLMGISLPRRYNGLNFSLVPYIMAADMVSRADAGFVNIWGLQDCAETIYEFADEDQRQRFLPRVCAGETMAMDLTEPDAGSDLQAVMLKATYNEADGTWRLNGVKRFITNGDGHIALVLARSEEGSHDGRGLSMFIYDRNDGGVTVRRIENKMGIKGSPTCELVFKNAKAELCGARRMGLIKYVMALMNGARLGIAAQSVGVSEAAYREALSYAHDRKQFGKPIIEFPAVFEMISLMKAKLDASRSLLYETTRFVDVYKIYEDIARERSLTPEERQEMKKYQRLADAFTPMAKGMGSEFCNQNAYDAVQVHGGSGFMKDYACERIYRDARITSIYEGTTQLQVVAAIRHVTTGTYLNQINAYAAEEYAPETSELKERLVKMTALYEEALKTVVDNKNTEYTDFHARRLVEMAGHIIMGYLLLGDTTRNEKFLKSANVYVNFGEAEVEKHHKFIMSFKPDGLENYR